MNRPQRQLAIIILAYSLFFFMFPVFFMNNDMLIKLWFSVSPIAHPITVLLVLSILAMNTPKKKVEAIEPQSEPEPNHTTVDILDAIKALIDFYGERKPKKHGNWVLLDLGNGEYFQMDTWNGAIHFKTGKPVYEYWTGFFSESGTSEYLGLSNKSWRHDDPLPLAREKYQAYYDKITAFINDQSVKKKEEDHDSL